MWPQEPVLTGQGGFPSRLQLYKVLRHPAFCPQRATMKAVLALLAIALALQPGAALQCYSCTAQVSNRDCQNVENCSQTDTYCWTSRVRAIGVLKLISKGCTSECVDDADNYYVGKKNITCCSTDLCNVSRAYGLQPATTLGLLTVLIGLLLWGSGQL